MSNRDIVSKVRAFLKSTVFSEMEIAGEEEKKELLSEKMPVPDAAVKPKITVTTKTVYHRNEENGEFIYEPYALNQRLINDMKKYADKVGYKTAFVPFVQYWPTYDKMDRQQKAWYFFWRTQVREGRYPDTDQSYIFLHIYELLSGYGWKDEKDGYAQLTALWMAYRERFPRLDNYLFSWCFDFTQLHHLEFVQPEDFDLPLPYQPAVRDLLIDLHSEEKPLRLPFAFIKALSDYSLEDSRFYKDGNQRLIQEAIPRVVALADAALWKKKGKGLLAVYGPNRTRKQSYYAFQGAVCPNTNRRIDIEVKAYTSSQKLRGYIKELVRYAENVLRGLYGYRGRLRNVELDPEMAALVESFLKKEYDPQKKKENEVKQQVEVKLDFRNINELRLQSDAVREALEVQETSEDVRNEKEMIDAEADRSREKCKETEEYIENDHTENKEKISQNSEPENLQQLLDALTDIQKEVLRVILTMDEPQNRLEQIAEEQMSMPEILLDEINEMATEFLDDILIDTFDENPCVLEEYVSELKEKL